MRVRTLRALALLLGIASSAVVAQTPPPPATASPAPASEATPKAIPPDSPKYGVYPVAYRELITRWLNDRLVDPASAKLEFSEPVAAEVTQKGVKAAGYSVDFRVNSRNKFGTYTGFQKHRVLIRNGEIIWADRVRG